MRVIEESGQDEADDAMFREGESSHPEGEAAPASGRSPAETSRAAEIIRRMPWDLSRLGRGAWSSPSSAGVRGVDVLIRSSAPVGGIAVKGSSSARNPSPMSEAVASVRA